MSNRFGETFYYAGNQKKQDSTTAISAKVGAGTLTVKTTASVDDLATLANGVDKKFDVKIQALGQAKVDKTTTSDPGTDANHNETLDGGDSYAEGVLGNAAANLAIIGYIKVTAAGGIEYSTDDSSYTSFTAGTGHAFNFFYGIAPAATSKESDETLAAYTLGLRAEMYNYGSTILAEHA